MQVERRTAAALINGYDQEGMYCKNIEQNADTVSAVDHIDFYDSTGNIKQLGRELREVTYRRKKEG